MPRRVGRVDRRHARPLGVGHHEIGVDHSERLEDPFAQEHVERLVRGDLDDAAEDVGRQAVVPRRARLAHERLRRELVDALLQRHVSGRQAVDDPDRPVGVADGPVVQEAVGQARTMGEEIADGHAAPRVLGLALLAGDALLLEGRDEARHRIVQAQLALLVEHHDRHAGDRLAHRRDAEDGVLAHRRLALDVLEPGRVDVDHLAVARDERDDAAGFAASRRSPACRGAGVRAARSRCRRFRVSPPPRRGAAAPGARFPAVPGRPAARARHSRPRQPARPEQTHVPRTSWKPPAGRESRRPTLQRRRSRRRPQTNTERRRPEIAGLTRTTCAEARNHESGVVSVLDLLDSHFRQRDDSCSRAPAMMPIIPMLPSWHAYS